MKVYIISLSEYSFKKNIKQIINLGIIRLGLIY